MQTAPQWKRHFARRLKSLDGHVVQTTVEGMNPGSAHSLVGFLAEVCPPGSLEVVEALVRNTVLTTISDGVSREIPAEPAAVRAAVEGANEWLRCVRAGAPAGGVNRIVSLDEGSAMMRSGFLVAGGLILIASPEAVHGLQLALQPRPLQSEKVKVLSVAMEIAMSEAVALAPLL